MTRNVLPFTQPESKNMSDKQQDITALGTEYVGEMAVLIREHGPLTLAKLARHVWTNKNHKITVADRGRLHEFLKVHAGAWENPKGKVNTWQIVGYVAPPKQGTLDAPGMARDVHPVLDPLVQALSIARLDRLKLLGVESEAEKTLVTEMVAQGVTEYPYEDHEGIMRVARVTIGKTKVKIPKADTGEDS